MEGKREETLESKAEEIQDVDSLKKALEEEAAKAGRYMDNWRRAEADFDNYRKRTEQEKGEVIRFANAALILNLLPILDDFERAFNSLPAKVAGFSWVDGMRLVYRKLQATLEAQGISPIKAEGENFDPAIHDAVAQGEGEEGKVIEEIQKGYKLHNRLIRPALVIVGKGTEEKQAGESGTQEGG